MSEVITTKVVTTTVKKTVTLDRKAIQRLLAQVMSGVPVDANIYIDIPGGGDWSNTSLDISSDNPVTIEWTETTTEHL
jgi:hypothetical protein